MPSKMACAFGSERSKRNGLGVAQHAVLVGRREHRLAGVVVALRAVVVLGVLRVQGQVELDRAVLDQPFRQLDEAVAVGVLPDRRGPGVRVVGEAVDVLRVDLARLQPSARMCTVSVWASLSSTSSACACTPELFSAVNSVT
jgi:hypothetical protein